ncbi:hypothetical protein ACFL27_17465 [candidate division CSSED10-310 bacterium]|uniref:Yip1 domain-containing protein n=1 Tax=candidate division CSSED10-310 bacterium TaxID=2855610 RepID=A0ABV6Z0M4_UNCC1
MSGPLPSLLRNLKQQLLITETQIGRVMEHQAAENQEPEIINKEPIEPQASPLLPRNVVDLFIHPTKFFSSQIAIGKKPYFYFVTWCYGICHIIDRIDRNILRSNLGRPRQGWEVLGPYLTESWPDFWAFVLITGALAGLILWSIGGWWYHVRLHWSGHSRPDPKLARLVFIYSSFVMALPTILVTLVQTVIYGNYQEAFSADELWSSFVLLFPFWSSLVSYKGAMTLFELNRARALMWFVILPFIVYFFAFGIMIFLLTLIN